MYLNVAFILVAMTCPTGMVYKAMTTACPATCAKANAPAECTLPDAENCVCPDGKILKNDVCVSPAECGCVDEMGNMYDVSVLCRNHLAVWSARYFLTDMP